MADPHQNKNDQQSPSRISLNIRPNWAENAVSMSSHSVEIKFDHLRDLFYKGDVNPLELESPQTVSITLSPSFIGKFFMLIKIKDGSSRIRL